MNTIINLLREAFEKYTDNIAFIDQSGSRSITYGQLDELSSKIASGLIEKGCKKGDIIPVLMPRCTEYIAAEIGIMKAGCAFAPLITDYPEDRIEYIKNECKSNFVVDKAFVEECSDKTPFEGKSELCENDASVVIYTSGSTGKPKGIIHSHKSLYYSILRQLDVEQTDSNDRCLSTITHSFSVSLPENYVPLVSGAAIVMLNDEERKDVRFLENAISQYGITNAYISPAMLGVYKNKSKTLKLVKTVGERLCNQYSEEYRIINIYGASETLLVLAFNVDKSYENTPIGKPVSGISAYILDDNGNQVKDGEEGELCVAGAISDGYLNLPEQTAKAYQPNPFSTGDEDKILFHTNDIVKRLENGNIVYVNRKDWMVKINGQRVEVGEIEICSQNVAGVERAVVKAFENEYGQTFLAGYFKGDGVTADDIKRHLHTVLPEYMIPLFFVKVDEFPLNANGKINRLALEKPVASMFRKDYAAPENETQKLLCEKFEEVLKCGKVGIKDNFFELGGDSIKVIKLQNSCNVSKLTSKMIFSGKTPENIARLIDSAADEEAYPVLPDYPITQTQNGIFVECAANPGTTIYNVPCLFKLGDNVDVNKLKKAVENTINAHPYIKTKLFINKDGEIRAKRNDEEKAEVEVAESAQLPKDEELVIPFTLLDSNLYRAYIYKTESGNYLFLDLHHIISDGTSFAVIIQDINSFYDGEAVEAESYTGFEAALDEEKARKTDAYTKAKEYYDSIFSGSDTEFLPVKDKNEPKPAVGKLELECDFSVESVKKYCDDNNITLNAFFNGVFGFVLSKYNYKDEALFTTVYNGRNDSRLSRAVTMLVKTFPVHCNTDGEQKISALLLDTKNQLMESMTNDIYSFAEISRAYDIKPDIMFVYQGDNFEFDRVGGEKAENIPLTLNAAKAPISVNVFIRNNRFVLVSDYRSDMYSNNAIFGMLECIGATAVDFLNKTYLKEVSMLSEKSKEILYSFNDTDVPIEQTTCNKLFEKQAAENPDKTAVIANKTSLTYKELNENANRIAHSLIESGVKPDDMVGVMMPRTVYAYTARQGVLKAGGAFMPLDPKYPDDRISYIFDDSKSKLVVTTEQIANERKALFEKCGVAVLTLEEMLKSDKIDNPDAEISPSNLCYCIYTSGSTGKPKGVMIEHHSLVNFVDYNRTNVQSCEFCDNMTVSLALAALTFDVSVLEESLPLYHGTTVAMANEDEINNPVLLAQMLVENKVDVMKCTPSYMNNMLDVPQVVEALKNMKAIDIGAEAFPAPLYDKMRKAGITAKIHNGYGPTEATITTSIDVVESSNITIGKPLCNTKVYMLDKHGNILPPYVPGELTVLGECVGRGYVGKEELTRDKFITFENLPAYKSGDLAFWGYDGKIHFMGRMDNQVKLRGLRVELDEIENVMNDYPSVLRSVVLVKENPQAGQFLCGYFTASEKVDKESLTEHMKRSLTHYMIPSVLIQLDALPLTNNGKVDKKALPEPELTVEKKEYIAPKNDLQKKLCDMFAAALGAENVGIDENFFEIGGTSLSASKIAMRAMTEALPIAYGDIFDNPTVEMLEQHILKQQGKSAQAEEKQEEIVLEGVDRALQYNTPKFVDEVEYTDIGNVLLTGSTGFLGIHILNEIIKHTDSIVYCLIRRGKSNSIESRLKSMLVYYFSNAMDELFGKRIIPIEGDITDKDVVMSLEKYDFKTVINCAACVKHFTNDDTLERINVSGVENLISMCVKTGRRLVQISTTSVAGVNVNRQFPPEKKIHENELYFGQDLSNKYVDTKFRAEKAVLEAVANNNLDGKIIRVGNLMSRHSDGEFQVNANTNGFMRVLRAYATIGKFPVSRMDEAVEFSPIDYTAAAVMCLAGTNSKFTVFQACNGHYIEMGDVIDLLNKCGIKIEVVKDKDFIESLNTVLKDEKKNMLISGLISYATSDSDRTEEFIGYDNSFTTKALYRLGFKWPIINEKYLANALNALATLGFFDGSLV